MSETTDAVLRGQLQAERDRLRDQLQRLGHGDRRRRSTSTRTSPTRARSPPSGARSTRSPASSTRRSRTSRTRSPSSTRAPTASARTAASAIAEARLEAMPAARLCIDLRFAASLSAAESRVREHRLEQAVIYFGCLDRRGHPARDQPRRRRARGSVTTPRSDAGRLTLNPVPHIDPFGSIILPAMGALTGLPVLAWAKPVPVNPSRLRNPRRDMLFVSLAGPLTNFVLDGRAPRWRPGRSTTRACCRSILSSTTCPLGIRILFSFAVVNLFLGLFNLLPIPPLDGSALLERVLPEEWLPNWYQFRPYGILVLFLLVFSTGVRRQDPRPVLRPALFGSCSGEARCTSRGASCARSGPGRRAPEDVAWVRVGAHARRRTSQWRLAAEPRPPAHHPGRPRRARRSSRARRTPTIRAGSPPRCCTTSASSTPVSACTGAWWQPCPARPAAPASPRRGRSGAASPGGSACTSATPRSAPTGSASPAARRRPRSGRPRTTTRPPGTRLAIPEPVVAALAAADND